jgi:hypothetical protein
VLPSWLSSTSQATWNPATNTLSVTGPSTVIADPGSAQPNIVASGATASVSFNPTSGTATDFHIAGLTLLGGATATETSLDQSKVNTGTNASNHATNHDTIVIEESAGDNNLSVSGGLLDLSDNDLIYYYDSSVGGKNALAAVQGQVSHAFDTTSNVGSWDGTTGITSSAAAIQANNYNGATGLGVIDNNDPNGNGYSSFDGENFGSNLHEILVKYTYNGDSFLEGTVNNDGLLGFQQGLLNTSNGILTNTWMDGNYDFSSDGSVGNNELLYFQAGLAAVQAGAPLL